jgi:gliding motility-associated-like protein
VTNLASGNYAVVLMDGFSCSVTLNLQIASASADSLSLGPDRLIVNGDTVVIDPQLSFAPSSFTWSGDIALLDPNALYNVISPSDEQTIVLTAVDANGCSYADTLIIRVKLESSIIVPNVFTPNGDGINDIVFPTADASIAMIEYWDIYDNWGEHVHGAKNFAPNDPSFGWDGTFKGKKMRNHVFVWRMSAVNSNGFKLFRYGNITLVR